MLGSRFDFKAKLDELGARRGDVDRRDDMRREESCVEMEREIADVAKTVHAESGNCQVGGKPGGGVGRGHVVFRCPVCDDFMRIGGESELSEFAGLDVTLHRLECDSCGMVTGRVYHPSIGYHDRLVR